MFIKVWQGDAWIEMTMEGETRLCLQDKRMTYRQVMSDNNITYGIMHNIMHTFRIKLPGMYGDRKEKKNSEPTVQ